MCECIVHNENLYAWSFSGGKDNEFINKVQETHGDNKYALVYRAAVEVAKLQIKLDDE